MVVFGTPCFDKSVSLDYHHSLVETIFLLTRANVSWNTHVVSGKCFIDLARNEIVAAFLKGKATDLLFIDSDVGWDPAVIGRVLASPESIVAGLVPKRSADSEAEFHQNALTGVIRNGLFESKEAPTAFMRIKRSVFARLDEAYGYVGYENWPHTPYFQTGGQSFLGEDIFFCRQWCALGESIWIDPDITFAHRGSKLWKGNFYEHCINTGLLNS